MDEILTERSDGILRVELNRPSRKNAMTSGMYIDLADIFNDAARDASTRVVLWHGAGDSFCAGNDIEDFLKNPPGPGESPQARLENAFVDFDKPLVAAVQGAAIGGGTTMLTHCDFVLAGRSAQFRMPFVDLAVVPEFGSSWSVPARIGHLRAAELLLLGSPFDAERAQQLGLVTRVVADQTLLQIATETARELAAKPAGALQASKRLMKRAVREQIKAAMKAENEEFSRQVRSDEAREALTSLSREAASQGGIARYQTFPRGRRHDRNVHSGRQVRIQISASDKTAMAYAARAGARPGDRLSRHEALHLSPVARAHRAARVQPRQARRRRRRHRRRARLGQQSIPGGLLCRSHDGGCPADGECPAAAGTDRLHDQSRGLVGASRQR